MLHLWSSPSLSIICSRFCALIWKNLPALSTSLTYKTPAKVRAAVRKKLYPNGEMLLKNWKRYKCLPALERISWFAMKISNTTFLSHYRSAMLGEKRWNFYWVLRIRQGRTILNELKMSSANLSKARGKRCLNKFHGQTTLPYTHCKDTSQSSCSTRQRGCKFHALPIVQAKVSLSSLPCMSQETGLTWYTCQQL